MTAKTRNEAAERLISFCEIEVPYWGGTSGQEARWEEYSRLLREARSLLHDSAGAIEGDDAFEAGDLLDEALAAERRATVERIRAAVRSHAGYQHGFIHDVLLNVILDEEAAMDSAAG